MKTNLFTRAVAILLAALMLGGCSLLVENIRREPSMPITSTALPSQAASQAAPAILETVELVLPESARDIKVSLLNTSYYAPASVIEFTAPYADIETMVKGHTYSGLLRNQTKSPPAWFEADMLADFSLPSNYDSCGIPLSASNDQGVLLLTPQDQAQVMILVYHFSN